MMGRPDWLEQGDVPMSDVLEAEQLMNATEGSMDYSEAVKHVQQDGYGTDDSY